MAPDSEEKFRHLFAVLHRAPLRTMCDTILDCKNDFLVVPRNSDHSQDIAFPANISRKSVRERGELWIQLLARSSAILCWHVL